MRLRYTNRRLLYFTYLLCPMPIPVPTDRQCGGQLTTVELQVRRPNR